LKQGFTQVIEREVGLGNLQESWLPMIGYSMDGLINMVKGARDGKAFEGDPMGLFKKLMDDMSIRTIQR
jgi:hypothetical protein